MVNDVCIHLVSNFLYKTSDDKNESEAVHESVLDPVCSADMTCTYVSVTL